MMRDTTTEIVSTAWPAAAGVVAATVAALLTLFGVLHSAALPGWSFCASTLLTAPVPALPPSPVYKSPHLDAMHLVEVLLVCIAAWLPLRYVR